MKLKTLKDIVRCPDCRCIDEPCVDYAALKRSAIKWILAEKKVQAGFGTQNEIDNIYYMNGVSIWIKHFFGITEVDLK